jgi:hypothetical protein
MGGSIEWIEGSFDLDSEAGRGNAGGTIGDDLGNDPIGMKDVVGRRGIRQFVGCHLVFVRGNAELFIEAACQLEDQLRIALDQKQ